MKHTEVFNRWHSERMGHPLGVQLGKSAVDELKEDNAELREALQLIKDKLNDANSLNRIEAFIYMICDSKLNK